MKNIVIWCHSLVVKDYRLLKIIFTILTLYLIFDNFYTYLVLKPTYTSHEKRALNTDDFPEIILCPQPSIDLNALKSLGYDGPSSYFHGKQSGRSKGWGNNPDDIKNISLIVSALKSVENCEHPSSRIGLMDLKEIKVKFNLTAALHPHHICCKVHPPKQAKSHPLLKFKFAYSTNVLNVSFRVFLADQMTASVFEQHKNFMLGDKLVSSKDGYMVYKVKILEESNIEGDPKYPCKEYKIMGQYAKCLENEVIKEHSKFINCTPPWMTKNEDLWCKGKYKRENMRDYGTFLDKIGISEIKLDKCQVPCRVKRYQATEIGLKIKRTNLGGLKIWFENEVDVTKSLWAIDEKTLISNIGGFTGIGKEFLWLIILMLSSFNVLITYFNCKSAVHK